MDEAACQAYDYGVRSPVRDAWTPENEKPGPLQARSECSDRFIPSRAASDLESGLTLLSESSRPPEARDENNSVYAQLLRSELLGIRPGSAEKEEKPFRSPDSKSLFKYKSCPQVSHEDAFSLSPVSFQSSRLLSTPRKAPRKIAKVPFKVLDAPQLQDDFYLNLVDWSSANVLSV
ncbi:Fzr1, partial [Symbiodinium necroappetens]